jgi:hypothetical protein
VRARPMPRGREPWRGKSPGELSAGFQSKPLGRVANSRVEQNPEGEGMLGGLHNKAGCGKGEDQKVFSGGKDSRGG